jgi:hypothetical protein
VFSHPNVLQKYFYRLKYNILPLYFHGKNKNIRLQYIRGVCENTTIQTEKHIPAKHAKKATAQK